MARRTTHIRTFRLAACSLIIIFRIQLAAFEEEAGMWEGGGGEGNRTLYTEERG